MKEKTRFEKLLNEEIEAQKEHSEELEAFNRALSDSYYDSVADHNDISNCLEHDFTDDEYFGVNAYSSTLIKLYIKNPSLVNFSGFKQKDHEIKESSDKKLGSAIHRILLENYPIRSFDSNLTPKYRETLRNMIKSLSKSPKESDVLNNVEAFERAIFWSFPCRNMSLQCKAKVDFVTKDKCLFDLKTVPVLEDMEKQIDNFRYDLQLSFYLYGWEEKYQTKIKDVCILAVEKNPPYEWRIFRLGEDYLERGRYGGLTRYKESVPGWEDIIEEMHFNPRSRFTGSITDLTLG